MVYQVYDYELIKEIVTSHPGMVEDAKAVMEEYNRRTVGKAITQHDVRRIIYRRSSEWFGRLHEARRGRPPIHDHEAILQLRKEYPQLPMRVLRDYYNGGRVGPYLSVESLKSILRSLG